MTIGPTRIAAPARVAPATRMRPARALLAMTRPSQIALVAVIYLVGVLYGSWRGATTDLGVMAGLLLAVGVAAAVHLANEAADHETDRLSRRTPFSGGSGALAASGLEPRVPLVASLVISVAVAALLVAALVEGSLPVAAIVLLGVGLVGGLAYSLPPVAAMRRGWGEPLNAILGAMALPLLGVAVVAGSLEAIDVVAFAPLLCVVFASVLATAWPDRDADAVTGKATMQVRLAPSRLRLIHGATTVGFFFASLVVILTAALPSAWALLVVTPLLLVGVGTYTRRRSPLPNVLAMVGLTAVYFAALALEASR